jgi:hypothetical protein
MHGAMFTVKQGEHEVKIDRDELEKRVLYLQGWLDGHYAGDEKATELRDELTGLISFLSRYREWTWEDYEREGQDTTPNADEYGYCAMCNKPMSGFDEHHSQGNHCADCFREIQRQIAGGEVKFSIKSVEAPLPYEGYEKGFSTN